MRDKRIQNLVKDLRAFWKNNYIDFKYFRKILHLKSFDGVLNIYRILNNVSVLNTPGMSIFDRITPDLSIFVNMTPVWTGVWMQLWKFPEYFRIPNMSSCYIYEGYARL